MKRRKALLTTNEEYLWKKVPEFLEKIKCDVVIWPKFEGIDRVESERYDLIILNQKGGLYQNGEPASQGLNIAKKLTGDERTKDISRILLTESDVESSLSAKDKNLFRKIIQKSSKSAPEDLIYAINKYSTVPLNIGIDGLGHAGIAILNEIRNQLGINSISLHSEHYKGRWDEFFKFAGIQERRNINTYDRLEEMFYSGPELDILIECGSKRGQTAPKKRETKLKGTMGALKPRLPVIMRGMKDEKIDMYWVISGPQDLLFEYLRRKAIQIGAPELTKRITSLSPDPLRAKHLVREILGMKNLEEICLRVIGGRGKEALPLLSSCMVDGGYLFDKVPDYEDPTKLDEFRQKLGELADNEVRGAKKQKEKFVHIQEEVKKVLSEIAQYKSEPSISMYAWNPEYEINMQEPVINNYGKTSSIDYNKKAMPELSKNERMELVKWANEQKGKNDKLLKSYLRVA